MKERTEETRVVPPSYGIYEVNTGLQSLQMTQLKILTTFVVATQRRTFDMTGLALAGRVQHTVVLVDRRSITIALAGRWISS